MARLRRNLLAISAQRNPFTSQIIRDDRRVYVAKQFKSLAHQDFSSNFAALEIENYRANVLQTLIREFNGHAQASGATFTRRSSLFTLAAAYPDQFHPLEIEAADSFIGVEITTPIEGYPLGSSPSRVRAFLCQRFFPSLTGTINSPQPGLYPTHGDATMVQNIAQALAHFSVLATDRQFFVCNLQAFLYQREWGALVPVTHMVYDATVHWSHSIGPPAHGEPAVAQIHQFLRRHTCGSICHELGLSSETAQSSLTGRPRNVASSLWIPDYLSSSDVVPPEDPQEMHEEIFLGYRLPMPPPFFLHQSE
ncbi:hypothetical protein SISSUDRAFT_1038125 [Sistotremastrum suecicum HHB10207 ss-3]|uniref:Alpha-type protein kinase domain-containing protein n=1 Tax=Sistotremastrum suecicum HHB10207 ss-3 TaxID=1314776 RepID=A0A165X6U0_9AGAM|nr:hypothetical protein SISSUDRAFT_1038125 [Sistotremastrum suecicum HHB10207 ss-3]